MGHETKFKCWSEGIAWYSCSCGCEWISARELEGHRP